MLSRLMLPALAASLGVGVYMAGPFSQRDVAIAQEADAAAPQAPDDRPSATTPAQQAPDPAADLARKRDETRAQLDALSKTISLSSDKTKELEDSIASLDKSTASLRQALIAARISTARSSKAKRR